MKIAEETGDPDVKEQAKVNFGMANASMKWTSHVSNILQNIEANEKENQIDEDDEDGLANLDSTGDKLPDINKR
jgi:hypothetical protein